MSPRLKRGRVEKGAERRNGQGEPQKRGEGGRRGHRRKTTLGQDRKIDFESAVTKLGLQGNVLIYEVEIIQLYLFHSTVLKVK